MKIVGTIMLLLGLAVTSHAAPLLSPRAAAVPKVTPMARFAPAGVTTPTYADFKLKVSYQCDFNFDHCDTNVAGCSLYDITDVSAVLKGGGGFRLEYTDSLPADGWTGAAQWGTCGFDCDVGFTWFQSGQRVKMRIFRAVSIPPDPDAFAPASANPVVWVNPELIGQVRTWTRPVPGAKLVTKIGRPRIVQPRRPETPLPPMLPPMPPTPTPKAP